MLHSNLRKEIQSIRKAGALRAGDKSQNKICARYVGAFLNNYINHSYKLINGLVKANLCCDTSTNSNCSDYLDYLNMG